MIKQLFYSLLILIAFSAKATNLSEVDSLISQRKYLSAWNLLGDLEKKDESIDIQIKKIELSLKYFTKTYSHQLFSFTDLKPFQNLIELRQIAEGKMVQMYPFDIANVIDSLQKVHPSEAQLKKTQGDFYYDIFILYGKDWKVDKQEVIRRMFEGYSIAENAGIVDHISMYALGYFWNINEDGAKAIQYFKKSLSLDSNYAPTHYNLAYLYAEQDSIELAYKHSFEAYKRYTYIDYKNDAGQMAGSMLGKLGRHEEAIQLLMDCDKLIPNTYYTYYYLLNSFLATNRAIEYHLTAKNMFALDWKSHTINTDIITMFYKNDKLTDLEQFYNDRLEEEKFDKEYRGYIFLHLAQAFEMAGNTEKTQTNIHLAEESFNICYDPGHPVFTVLSKMKK